MASNNKQGRSTPIAIWGTAIVLVLLAVYAVHSLSVGRVSVHTAQATYADIVKTRPTNGKVQLKDDVQFRAQAPGQVKQIYVKPLEHVHKGQVLLRLDDANALATLAHARAALQTAQLAAANVSHGGTQEERTTSSADLSRFTLQLQQDQTALAAVQKLLAQGAASPAEVAAVQHRVQIDQNNIQGLQSRTQQRYTPADLSSAQAQVAEASASVLAAQSALDDAVIRSPIDGIVYYLPVSQYEYVNTGDKLVNVANDLTHMLIAAYFDEPDIGTLAVGQPVAITWEAKPGMTWHGRIIQTPTTIQQYQNRFVGEAIIAVDDVDGVLQPDANVNLQVTIAQHQHVLTVPREALHFDGPQPFVFRIQNGKLVRTNVRIGLVNLTEFEIDSGLTEGETVALNATTNAELNNHESVTAIP